MIGFEKILNWWKEHGDDARIRHRVYLCRLIAPFVIGALVAYLPSYEGLSGGGRAALLMLVVAAGLWITEAIPAFAVSLLVIAFCISVLGRPGGVMDAEPYEWEKYLETWGSPLIWLFFGGLALSRAAERTGLTEWISIHLLSRVGERPWLLIAACMSITFTFSMFISNTAAATMMVAIVMPIVRRLAGSDPLRKGLLLGIAIAANVGGMGTVIGSPPNAIAAGALRDVSEINFARWMLAGLPPALLMLVTAWGYILARYPAWVERVDFQQLAAPTEEDIEPLWRRVSVIATFCATVTMWMTQTLHGIPAPVISFLPICVFTSTRILSSHDICNLRWDVLLLIAGGLSLGIAVTDSGLATWLVETLRLNQLDVVSTALVMAYIAIFLSNLMSNTAAANMLIPVGLIAASGFEAQTVAPIALSASAAMALPISTPPNAIVHASNVIETKDLVAAGLLFGLVAPPLTVVWCQMVL